MNERHVLQLRKDENPISYLIEGKIKKGTILDFEGNREIVTYISGKQCLIRTSPDYELFFGKLPITEREYLRREQGFGISKFKEKENEY